MLCVWIIQIIEVDENIRQAYKIYKIVFHVWWTWRFPCGVLRIVHRSSRCALLADLERIAPGLGLQHLQFAEESISNLHLDKDALTLSDVQRLLYLVGMNPTKETLEEIMDRVSSEFDFKHDMFNKARATLGLNLCKLSDEGLVQSSPPAFREFKIISCFTFRFAKVLNQGRWANISTWLLLDVN